MITWNASRWFVIVISLLVILSSAGVACKTKGPKANSPEGVAVKFMKHLSALEFDEARKLCTDDTKRFIDMLQSLYDIGLKQGADMDLQKKDVKINIIKVAVDGNTAVVTYTGEDEKVQTLNMVRVKGKWLVDMKKENPAG